MAIFGWKLHGDGKTIAPGDAVAPSERLTWPRTIGLGFQHVFAMFGATFVFPVIMGLNPQLAVMMSGFGTIIFLLIVSGKVPSYVGTSAAFVGGTATVTAQGGSPAQVTGAILVSGAVLTLVGAFIHWIGASALTRVLPAVVTGGVVMLIGFNLAPVVANTYWPQDQWVALLVMAFIILFSVCIKGFIGRVAVFLGLIFGYLLSWLFDTVFGKITSFDAGAGEVTEHFRIDWSGVQSAPWIGLPPVSDEAAGVVGLHLPEFNAAAIVVMLPAIIALVAENVGHVKAVEEMTGEKLDKYTGRAVMGDGVATMVATGVGGSPTTTYAENIGVMAATKVYSTAAYWVAAIVAIVFGLSPKFGALIASVPGGVLGGITVVLYGMIGMLGAKIWIENKVDFSSPLNMVPVAAGIIIAIGDVSLKFSESFTLSGIALGTLVMLVMYHVARWLAPKDIREAAESDVGGTAISVGSKGLEERVSEELRQDRKH
ncbi:uracil-xanthine permease family protein [Brevibacterium sp. 50QC2O2]|jgi:uracil-xanthine permease|uniref:uracil-xanthine permease family protein n=1 Tax=Brevibacterium TaxID=1696 RepID=UPI00211C68C1|nr:MULTISPECIES: uracil-xanthine permease family protein [unclassified Brevibacterium]MCQ9368802.1 uracil-xanthine permease family protein [Brevibacterium sp. 91QC2O2]MCQ9386186.1 uracil-xanthine permease family protein [Brevibacterium sp. 68QC2CO]MCQ9388553.1 uracil-xanthine permease family protein [Brevibacterium sp. 50QC2O2]